jgi:hypothetical protein
MRLWKKITILTEPIENDLLKKIYKELVIIKGEILRKPDTKAIFPTGPEAVLKSLLNGFDRLNIKYNLNPKEIREVGKTVIVLSDVEALKQAIGLKKKKEINILLAGPNLVIFSSDFNYIIASPEIDVCLVPSKQVAKRYVNDAPILASRIKVWYAGIDENYWKPNSNCSRGSNVLIYHKNASSYLRNKVTALLIKYRWNPIHITYGRYTPQEFKSALLISKFAVFLSRSESQGIALAESWAMNVPTFVWNPKTINYLGNVINNTSSAPYLSKTTGMEWEDIKKFEAIIMKINNYFKIFNPRQWILTNMTDIKSAELINNIINNNE